ncbi:LapA family protein [Rhodobacteraceae bacterium 63075]|nr:LapA family protein [Rhodobacteraceae bacterium 63075]
MRLIKYSFLAAVAVILMVLALANRGEVTLTVLPAPLASATGFSWAIELPLFVVIFGGVLAGLFIGFVWEWLREHKHRAEASRKRSEVQKLESELKRLKGQKARDEGDEVLALLDEAS